MIGVWNAGLENVRSEPGERRVADGRGRGGEPAWARAATPAARLVWLLLAGMVWVVPGNGLAQPHGGTPGGEGLPEERHETMQRAPVVIDGEPLFLVRGLTAFPAPQRASAIADRIVAVAADPSISPNAVELEDTPDEPWTRVVVGGQVILTITEADARAEGVLRRTLASATLRRIKQAIVDYRAARDPEALTRSAVYALIATAVALLLGWVVLWTMRLLDRGIEERLRAHVSGLERQSFRIIRAKQLWAAVHSGLNAVRIGLVLAVVYAYLNLTLGLFPWTRGLARNLFAFVVNPLQTLGIGLIGAVPNLVSNFDREWAPPTYRIVRVLVIAFALVISYPYIPGSGSEAFKGVSIFLGVVFSLGSSSIMASIMAGYAMTYRRAFRVGDRVRINDVVGDVLEVRLMVTRLRSLKNEEVVIPNSAIQNETVINYSAMAREKGLILHTTVGIGYETPWRQVEAMLLLAAERTPGLMQQPPPFVLQQALGDFAVTYELNVYCDTPQASMQLYTELHRNILDVFNEYGVQIMTPAYEGDPEQAKVVPKDQWHAPPAATPPPNPQPKP